MKKGEGLTRRTVTTARQEANRASAAKSTGPRSPQGKATVARNATTHGIFARAVCVHDESVVEFTAFHEQLARGLAPVDEFEALLVERMAVALWKSRRLLRFERSEVNNAIRLDAYLLDRSEGVDLEAKSIGARKVRAERRLIPDEDTLYRLLKYGTALDKEWTRCYLLLLKHREAKAEADLPGERVDLD